MLKCTSFALLLVLSQVAMAKSVGTVTFSAGDVTISHADKTVTKAEKNAELNAGDAIETKEGRVQLSMIDGGKISLQPNTIYKINQFEYTGKEDGSEYNFTELVKGGLRTISGLIGHKNRDHYQLKTAVATIGIRGTEFTVNFNDNILLMTTNHGSVDVCNAGGCLNAITGQSIQVAGIGGAPKPSNKAAKAAVAPPPAAGKAVFAAGEQINTAALTTTPVLQNYNGAGFISEVMKTTCGCGFDGVFEIQIETDNNAKPTKLTFAGAKVIQPISFSSVNNDGIIGWGRITPGTLTSGGVNNTIEWMDYAIGAKPDPAQLANFRGTYNVFGSTAPIFLRSGGTSLVVGLENAVTGALAFDFNTANYNYNLNVVAGVVNYGLNGSGNALNAANPIFQTGGTVTNVICSIGACSPALQGGNLIQGAFFGQNGERIGLQYGFNVPLGAVYGTAVLK